jgi:DNA (cytosine-5)-methyltransferase 1
MKLLDLFSGVGGFHLGMESAGWKFDWVGHSDIDKYANAVYQYNFKHKKQLNVENLGDVKLIRPEDLPKDITIICGGFPCQSFSIAGKRDKDDPRGTLFFEIVRILRYFREMGNPIPYILFENVQGLLSHDEGHTFATILRILSDLDYSVESQLVNTRWILPQNRSRIYLCGVAKEYLGDRCRGEIFPIGEDGNPPYGERSVSSKCSSTLTSRYWKMGDYDTYVDDKTRSLEILDKKGNTKPKEFASTLSGGGHSGGNHSDMDLLKIDVKGADYRNDEGLRIRSNGLSPTLATSRSGENHLSRMIGLVVEEELNESQSGKVYDPNGIAPTLNSGGGGMGAKTGLYKVHCTQSRNPNRPSLTRECDCGSKKLYKKCCGVDGGTGLISKDDGTTYCLDSGNTQAVEFNYGQKSLNETLEKENLDKDDVKMLDLYNKKAQDISPTLTEPHHNNLRLYNKTSIRRLTPNETERLQGFSWKNADGSWEDGWTKKGLFDGKVVDISDTQRYKQMGNAVTVPIVQMITEKLLKFHEENNGQSRQTKEKS